MKTLSEIKAQLAQYFAADESNDNAMQQGLRAQMAQKDAERARILADDYPEHKAIRANVKAQIDAGHREAYAAAGRPWLRLPTLAPSQVLPEPSVDMEDVDAFIARMQAKYGPT